MPGEKEEEKGVYDRPLLATPQESGNNEVIFMALDLASLASVRAFATAFLSSEPRLDILIHNAGEGSQPAVGWVGARGSQPTLPGRLGRGTGKHVGRMPPTTISPGGC